MTIEDILKAGCVAVGAPRKLICGRRRDGITTQKRAWIAAKMREAGYSYPAIGKALRRHHSTIMFLLGMTKAARR